MSDNLLDVVLPILEDLATPRSLTVALLARHGEWQQLVALTVDVHQYVSVDRLKRDLQATELLRKFEGLPTGIDLDAVALRGFWQSESACCATNILFDTYLNQGPYTAEEAQYLPYLARARSLLQSWLGPLPHHLDVRLGPGATYEDTGSRSSPLHKFSHSPSTTSLGRCLLPYWYETAWGRLHGDSDVPTVRGNRFTTVPKDSTKNRGIAVEPSLNVSFQLAVGLVLKDRLRRLGIDLRGGQALHRDLAARGSTTGEYCTIDLSSASDTVAKKLVQFLLPAPWYGLLSSLRSPLTRVGEQWVYLEKFSSMGNGFTFELETLIFLALICAIDPSLLPGGNVWVYGDDIIVPTCFGSAVVGALRFAGFTPNPRKTFLHGRFRESCGGDYFDGVDVRPHYLKSLNTLWDYYTLHNGLLARWKCGTLVKSIRRLPRCVPIMQRVFGPSRLGDVLFHRDNSRDGWHTRVRFGITSVRACAPQLPKLDRRRFHPDVVLVSLVYGTVFSKDGRLTVRGDPIGIKTQWLSVS